MKQLVIDISEDTRVSKSGLPINVANEPRHARLWLWEDGSDEPRFVGELFTSDGELAQLLQAKPVLEFAATTAQLHLHWDGLVPEVTPHPKMGKAMAALKTLAKWFT